MQKYNASKLLETLLTPPRKPFVRVVFCDDDIFKRVTLESFAKMGLGAPKSYTGKQGIQECVGDAAAGSLFSPVAPAVVELEPKLTAKQWDTDSKLVARLPSPPEAPVVLFAPTALRNVIKEEKFSGEIIICWAPDVADAKRCVSILAKRYPNVAKAPADVFENWVSVALDYYSGSLLSVDLHFERMQRTGVDFEGAFVGQTGATAFHVVDALAEGNAALLELKMQQCITSGEDAAPILKAVAAFLRQLAQVYAGRERTSNLDAVFDNLNVRVPAQKKRLQVAMNRISPERVALFFMHAPELELSLRSHPMPHELLASELFGLLGVSAR